MWGGEGTSNCPTNHESVQQVALICWVWIQSLPTAVLDNRGWEWNLINVSGSIAIQPCVPQPLDNNNPSFS